MSRGRKRVRRREFPSGELALAAMVDMMINILIFLLTLYGTDPIDVRPTPDLVVPASTSVRPVQYAVELRVSTREVAVNGKRVLELQRGAAGPMIPDGTLVDGQIPALQGVLTRLAESMPPAADDGQQHAREIDIQCDRSVPWEVLGPVVDTAGKAGFVKLKFVVRTISEEG
jgi:biopolymer transport protein ExbD